MVLRLDFFLCFLSFIFLFKLAIYGVYACVRIYLYLLLMYYIYIYSFYNKDINLLSMMLQTFFSHFDIFLGILFMSA